MKPEELKAKIQKLKRQRDEAEELRRSLCSEIRELAKTCQHSVIQRHESAVCEICGSHFGWWCPDSPDHSCHYDAYEGEVELLDGSLVPVPSKIEPDYADEYCMFCHQPDERK